MNEPARIFISSSAQDEFNSLRESTFNLLSDLGHRPLMYENNFGPWPSSINTDAIEHCLNMVKDANIFLLFIHNNAGTYVQDAGRTITHLEFLKALEQQKIVIVFVEENIFKNYFHFVNNILKQKIEEYLISTGKYPEQDTLLKIIKEICKQKDVKQEVDPYIWLFLHDIKEKNIFCEPLSLGVGIKDKLKPYLSSILAQGSVLLPFKNEIKSNIESLAIYQDLVDLSKNIVLRTKIKYIEDWRYFLALIREKMKGGVINEAIGKYTTNKLGYIGNCSGVTIFKRNKDLLELIERDGRAGGENSYRLDDDSSFVTFTYNKNIECLFYREEKKLLYLGSRAGEYIICFHFPSNSWDKHKFESFKDKILNGILNIPGNALVLDFIKTVLGVLEND